MGRKILTAPCADARPSPCHDKGESALEREGRHLRALIATIPDLVWLKDNEGVYLACNRRFEQFFGVPEAQIRGKTDYDFVTREVADFFRANDRAAAAAGRPLRNEEWLDFPDGYRGLFETTKTPLIEADGSVVGVLGIAHDISARQNTERELRRLNRALQLRSDFRLYLSHADDEAMLLASLCRLIVQDGGYLMAWIGIAENDDSKSVRPVARAGCCDGYLDALRISWDGNQDSGRGPTGTAIRTGTTQVNQNVLTNAAMAPWRDAALRFGYQSSIALPMTGLDGSPGTLNIYAGEPDAFCADEVALLESLTSDLVFGLNSIRARASRDVARAEAEAKSNFLANMSHEIRTPLHVIIGLAHLLRRDVADPAQRDRLEQLCTTSDHLLGIINDVLDLTKIAAQRLDLHFGDFRVGDMTAQVIRLIADKATNKGLAFVTDIPPPVHSLELNGSPLHLAQVLINLCDNAVKFTDHGTICLRLSCLREDARQVALRFSVEDTGIGIAAADRQRLFEAFEQADNSLVRERGGTGLGLTISQHLVTAMGGRLTVDSEPNHGSNFAFELSMPRAKAGIPRPALVPPATDAETILAGKRILFAEDHPLSQEILLDMLEDLGCAGDIATDGAAAVARASAARYDLILMDMQMPRMDGPTATMAIRKLPGYSDTPIIALTANAFDDDRVRCLEAGMNGHLAKPVTPEILKACLTQWLAMEATPDAGSQSTPDQESGPPSTIDGLEICHARRRSPQHFATYRAQLRSFLAQHGNDMAELRQHLADGDPGAARIVAHRLTGIAGFLGARRIESLAGELDRDLRPDPDRAPDHDRLHALASACEAEFAELAHTVERVDSSSVV